MENETPKSPRNRHDGWSRTKMVRFVEALVGTGSVGTAAKSVGMSRQSAYRLRARLIGQPFDLAWEAALEMGLQQVAHEAMDRALNGTAVPILYRGEIVGERRVFNERAVMNLLRSAGRIGRHHFARDWSARNWDGMVRRLSNGPIVWTDDEMAANDPSHPNHMSGEELAALEEESEFELNSEDAQHERSLRLARAVEDFVEHESHYAQG